MWPKKHTPSSGGINWVLDLDVRAFFDSIDWELLLKAVRQHTDCPWVLLYVERWLKAPVQMEDGSVVPRTAGTPHLTDDLGLVELAAIVELSPHYFGEAFRISTGRSPHRYVMERRVECARDLLRDADRPIRDIAYAAGFSSQSHFTANFRRVTGVTPGRFRRSLP
jgi:AraC-like DNA-binding protein